MRVTAKLRYLRIAPRKVRLVADLIRGESIEEAQTILNFTIKKASLPLLKLLRTAAANAKNNFQLDSANLFISKITIDEAPKLKRWRPRARGQAYEIQKKASHVTIILDEIVKKAKKVKKVKKPEKAEKAPKVEKEVKKEMEKELEKPKLKPELKVQKPKPVERIKRIFQRKVY